MEAIRISSSQEILLHELATFLSFLFFLLMSWLAWDQVRQWRGASDAIAQQKGLRQAAVLIAVLIGVVTFLIFSCSLSLEELPLSLGLGVGIAGAFLAPTFAFAFFMALLILRPWEILTSEPLIAVLPRASGVLVLLALVTKFIREKKMKLFWSFECSLLALFTLWMFLSGLQSADSQASMNAFFDMMGKAAIVFFLVVNLVQKKEDSEFLKKVLVGGILCLLLLSVFYYVMGKNEDPLQRLSFIGMLGDPNDISAFGVMGLPFALIPLWRWSTMNSYKDRGSLAVTDYLMAVVYVLSFLTVLYMAQSRGAVLATAAFCGLFFMYRSNWNRKSFAYGLIAIACVLPAYQLVSSRESGDLSSSETNRLNYWRTAIRMAIKHPVLGVGYNQFPDQYENYLADEGSSEFGKRTAHSSWFLVLAENGFVGLALFVALFLSCARRAYQMRLRHPEFIFSIISYGVAMSFLSHSYLLLPYVLFSLITISFYVENKS